MIHLPVMLAARFAGELLEEEPVDVDQAEPESDRRITGDDIGARVRVREGEQHMQGGRTGIVIGWSAHADRRFLVKLDGEPRSYFSAMPGEVEAASA
jgi:hypothetical protein